MTRGFVQLSGKVFTTQVQQGALSAGGYNSFCTVSSDGSLILAYDGANGWKWNTSTLQFDNVLAQSRLPVARQIWGQDSSGQNTTFFGVRELAFAPNDSSRVYFLINNEEREGAFLLRSDDGGDSWTDTGYVVGAFINKLRATGPFMAVDPANKDHLVLGDCSGVIHRSFDAGATFAKSNPGALLSATATAASNPGDFTITVDAVPTDAQGNTNFYEVFPGNVSSANGSKITNQCVITNATDSTTVHLNNALRAGDKVNIGDTIVFGRYPCIAFDPSSGTTTVSGHTVTAGIYIGWGYGASQLYHSTDGLQSWTGIGGPAQIWGISCAKDGTLIVCDDLIDAQTTSLKAGSVHGSAVVSNITGAGAGGNCRIFLDTVFNLPVGYMVNIANVGGTTEANGDHAITAVGSNYIEIGVTFVHAYTSGGNVAHFFNAWKYQSSTWTQLTGARAGDGYWASCAADPFNTSMNGHLVFASTTGSLQNTINHGTDFYPDGAAPHTDATAAGDVPWLQSPFTNPPPAGSNSFYAAGRIAFDPITPGKVYVPTGVGLFYCTPPDPSGATVTLNYIQQNKNQQGLIVDDMCKPPGKGLLVAVQDKIGLICPSTTVEPAYNIQGSFALGWSCAYALSDPNFQIVNATTGLYQTTDGGNTDWSGPATIPNFANTSTTAAQTPTNFVTLSGAYSFQNNTLPTGSNVYTTDSSTFNECLFNGVPFPLQLTKGSAAYTLIADPNNASKYFFLFPCGFQSAFTITLNSGGAGYVVNDILNFDPTGQAGGFAVILKVTSVNGSGVIQSGGFSIKSPGGYGTPQSNPVNAVGGTGSGASFNATWSASGGLWASTDSGANWSNISGGIQTAMSAFYGVNTQLSAVPGQSGHLFASSGNLFAEAKPMMRSVDGGANFKAVTNTSVCWAVGVGKGNGAYGSSVYMSGLANGDTDFGMYRADDFSGDTTHMPTWKRLCGAPAGNMDRGGKIVGDPETYGTFYAIAGGTGYITGALV